MKCAFGSSHAESVGQDLVYEELLKQACESCLAFTNRLSAF